MKLRDLRTGPPDKSLPQLSAGEYAILFISDFWDGPKSGLLKHQGSEYWFEVVAENEDEDWSEGQWYRRFAVVHLTSEQLEREHLVHRDFQLHVGSHWEGGEIRPKSEWHRFYDLHLDYCRSRPFEDNEVVAWFET
jgi:hypothetical protein